MLFFTASLIQTALTAPLAKLAGSSVAARNKLLMGGFLVMVAADALFVWERSAAPLGMFLGAGEAGLVATDELYLLKCHFVSLVTSVGPGVG